jgi:hypothetical protein
MFRSIRATITVVTFYDVNGQKVASQEVVANEFGSFSGSFVTPQNVLTGSMNIQCETGNISVQVEEYKRPKFEVSFNPVQGAYKLGETIEVKGKAMAYAGNALTDAGVSFKGCTHSTLSIHVVGVERLDAGISRDGNPEWDLYYRPIRRIYHPVYRYPPIRPSDRSSNRFSTTRYMLRSPTRMEKPTTEKLRFSLDTMPCL